MKPINYLDGFSGYGGFHLALKNAGYEFNKCYYSEIDKYAIANYRYNFPESIYAGSITDIPTNGIIEELDLFTFGWPCQDNSQSGKRKGQRPGTRSGLLYSAVEIINKYKPRCFVAENVAGLYTVNKGIDIIESLKVLAFLNESCPQYNIEMQFLNTLWVLPQNRERLYFVGHLRGSGSREIFPITDGPESTETEKIFRSDDICAGTLNTKNNSGQLSFDKGTVLVIDLKTASGSSTTRRGGVSETHAYCLDHDCAQGLVLSENYQRGSSQGFRVYNPKGASSTISSGGGGQGGKTGLYEIGNRVRRLTPTECERLQGLPEGWTKNGVFEKLVWINKKEKTFRILDELSDSQRYKLCGNGVSIPIVKMIVDKLKQNYL